MNDRQRKMIHPKLRFGPLDELGPTHNVVAVIYCDMDMLWDISHAFGERDGFGRDLRALACELEEKIAEPQ